MLGKFLSQHGGGIASSLIGAFSAKQTNRMTRKLSNTAHQRQVKDLRKAGLNPILSATGGSGASTPVQIDPSSTAQSAVSNALSARKLNQEINNLKAQENKTNTETKVLETGVGGKTLGTRLMDTIPEKISSAKSKYLLDKEKQKNTTDLGKGRRSYKKGYSKTYK